MDNIGDMIKDSLKSYMCELNGLREEIHRKPELGYKEYNTTKLIKEFLNKKEVEFYNFDNLTGGYAYIDCKKDKTIGFRADIDALPILENTCINFKSENKGTMHACGHDVHITIAAGIAVILNSLKEYLNYNVAIIFQPAEESNPNGGARLIIEQGIIDKLNLSEIYGLHVWPKYNVGQIAIKEGPLMGSSDKFTIKVIGKNAHAAEPHIGVDAISIAIDIINAIEHKLRREIDPFEVALVSIGSINSTGRYNVICDNVEIGGTIRTISKSTRTFVHRRIEEISTQIANAFNGEVIVDISDGYPVLENNGELSRRFIKYSTNYLGESNVITNINPSLIGEDFSFYCTEVPSLYFFLGCESKYSLHSDKFLPKEGTIYTGIDLMSKYILSR